VSVPVIQLQFEAPPELTAVRARLASIDTRHFSDIAKLVGLEEGGAAIQVKLFAENSDLARNVPQWIAGFAVGGQNLVVLFPARSPSYPDSTIEDVLRHEIAHVLISRAAHGQPIPRWFDEGLAMAVERERGFQDQTQLVYQLMTTSRTNLEGISGLFRGGQNDQTRAYAFAGAIVHDALQQYGSAVCAQVLARVAGGRTFDQALADVTGLTPDGLEEQFWHRQRFWTMWVSILGSSTMLWSVITLLALLAIYMRRRRNRQIEERWAKEDGDDDGDVLPS
jgi:Peptidase MA superfamily